MVTDWKSPVLERTARLLGPRYIVSHIGEDSFGGYVGFNDPAMYREDWRGPIYGGIVRYSKAEILGLEKDPGSCAKIRKKVEAAKDALLAQVTEHRRGENRELKTLAVKALLSLLLIYPITGWLF